MTITFPCNHQSENDLDTICPTCGRNYLSEPATFYIASALSILFTYFILTEVMQAGLLLMLSLFTIFLIGSILRKRKLEFFALCLILLPTFYLGFKSHLFELFNYDLLEGIEYISIFVLSLPYGYAIILGFIDAAKNHNLESGSFWLILVAFIGLLLTALHLTLPVLIESNILNEIDDTLVMIQTVVSKVYSYRNSALIVLTCLITFGSIISAMYESLIIRKQKLPNKDVSENSNPISALLIGIIRVIQTFLEAIITTFNLAYQILAIAIIEVFTIIKNSLIRSILIILRLTKIIALTGVSFLLVDLLIKVSSLIELLWSSSEFIPMSGSKYGLLFLYILLSSLLICLLAIVANRKFRDRLIVSTDLRNTLVSYLGTKDSILISYRSVLVSVFTFEFLYSLTLLGAWIIILGFHFATGKNAPTGILLALTVALSIIAGVTYYLKETLTNKH